MRIRVFSEYPSGLVFGGIELHAMRTFRALKKQGVDVEFLDYFSPDNNFDILHIFGNPPCLYETCLFAAVNKKIVISAVCGATHIPYFKSFCENTFAKIGRIAHQRTDFARQKMMFNLASHVICLNELEKKYISTAYNVPCTKMTIIQNGVEDHFVSSDPSLFINKYGITDFVLFTGNIVKRKNPLLLAKALLKHGLKGVFIGKQFPPETAYANDFNTIINQSKNLLWIRGLDSKDPLFASAYRAATVHCLPSCGETQPQASLEAMATGTPIILGDYPYAYQPPFQNALRCDPNNEQSIITAIMQVFANRENFVQPLSINYSWDTIATNIVKIYESIM
jgi:glycosyltransferase involved in cell wall biosynthesis